MILELFGGRWVAPTWCSGVFWLAPPVGLGTSSISTSPLDCLEWEEGVAEKWSAMREGNGDMGGERVNLLGSFLIPTLS